MKNTVISPNFLVWKFSGKAQFPHSFGRIENTLENTPLEAPVNDLYEMKKALFIELEAKVQVPVCDN